jgi:4-amino-4-deoxy-L-arabinose transferase-like glycosyltransferase
LNNTHPSFARHICTHWADLFALLLAVAGFFASAWVTQRVFEAIPHIEDEVAYVWQAKALVEWHLAIPSPPNVRSFLVPFVDDYQGERFGKYPPGWPALLSLAIRLDIRPWINPLLAGLAVWLTYLLGKKIFSQLVGLLAAGLTATSPFFLMNSGSLLSHTFGLVLSASLALGWLSAFWKSGREATAMLHPSNRSLWVYTILAAMALGVLILTRPFTALAVAFPFGIHGVYLLIRSDSHTRLRLAVFGLIVALFVGLYFMWQYELTGNALLNPYTLWWPYDRVGFGPGHGREPSGHTLSLAWINTRNSLEAGNFDLFGWAGYSWVFLPFGLWAARRNSKGWLIGSVAVSLVFFYSAYWIGAILFGPRYYYEGLFSATLFSAVGIAWLAGWPVRLAETYRRYTGWPKLRPLLVTFVVGVLVGINLTLYLPNRLDGLFGLYGIEKADQQPFLTAQARSFTPALVIVHTPRWMEYGALLDLENPELTSPFIFAWSMSPSTDAMLGNDFPDRSVYHYYPEQPFQLYMEPLPNPH